MEGPGGVQVNLELGHRAQVRSRATAEGFTHDWTVFVRGPDHTRIQYFVDKVVFHLHESFPKPRRVCKDPPYQVEESGYAGFILPIEVYFKNKEEPKKVRFDYDLFLHLEGHPPVNHLRCEKLTFSNPTEDFRRKLLKAAGQRDPPKPSPEDSNVMVMQEGSTPTFGQHTKTCSSSFSTLCSEPHRTTGGPAPTDSSKGSAAHPLTLVTSRTQPRLPRASKDHRDLRASKDHRDLRASKDHKESRASKDHKESRASKDHKESRASKDHKESRASKDHRDLRASKDHRESKDHRDLRASKEAPSAFRDCGWDPSRGTRAAPWKPEDNQTANPKMAFKETKAQSKDPHSEHKTPSKVPGPQGVALSSTKHLSSADLIHHGTLKNQKALAVRSGKPCSDTQPSTMKLMRDRPHQGFREGQQDRVGTEPLRRRTCPPCQQPGSTEQSDGEEQSARSDCEKPSPTSTSSSNTQDTNESEDQDSDRPKRLRLTHHHHRRVSLSDGSESDSSSHSHKQATPPPMRPTHPQVGDVKSPTKQEKARSLDCDKDYLEELVELHRRLMALREGHILQQVVNVIEETGHFHISSSTFDFDLCSLDRATVRRLQTHLDSSGHS